jgi:MraZ protein
MFRGSAPAKIDDKGRLKVPTSFREDLESSGGQEVFVTSVLGEKALIFPLPEWEKQEARLLAMPSTNPARNRYLERVNFYGQQTRLDAQGRLVLPQLLRANAGLDGEVVVSGHIDHLEVWNRERLETRLAEQPFTEEDFGALSAAGI